MKEDEKAEPGDGEQEQLGPYQLDEQVSQSDSSQGELYRATHEERGSPALVFKPTAQGKGAPQPPREWEVLCVSSTAPPYMAVEVKHASAARDPDHPGTEELLDTFEQVAAGVKHMARTYDATGPRLPSRRLPRKLAGAAVGGVLLGALFRFVSMSSSPEGEGVHATQEPVSCEVPATLTPFDALPESATYPELPEEIPGLARPLPFAPLKGQMRPPCHPKAHVELVGACWMPHEQKAPCPNVLYEYEGKCYAPVLIAPADPSAKGD